MTDDWTPDVAGAAVVSEAAAAPGVLPACLRCGYDLRGSAPDAVCPECALPVRASIEGNPLLHAPPGWLRHVATGCGVSAAAIITLLGYTLCVRLQLLPRSSTRNPGEFPLAKVWAIGIDVSSVAGAWMLTRAEPTAQEAGLSRRRFLRLAVFFFVAVEAIRYLSPPRPRIGYELLAVAVGVSDLLFCSARMLYLRRLALRMAQPALAFQIALAFAGWAACSVAGTYLSHLFRLVWELAGRPRGFPLSPRPAAAGYGWWMFLAYEVIVLLLFRRAFLRVSGPARDGGVL